MSEDKIKNLTEEIKKTLITLTITGRLRIYTLINKILNLPLIYIRKF